MYKRQIHPKIFITTLTATAGGEIAAAAIAPQIAAYRICAKLTHIFSDQTDGSIALTFATTTGLTDGLAGITIATVAQTVTPDFGQGLYWRGSAVNEGLLVSCAAGQAGAAQEVNFIGVYWGEKV